MHHLRTALVMGALLMAGLAGAPSCAPDCTVTVYVPRYGYVPVQVEHLSLIPCLNAGACLLFEDGSIGPR